MHASIYLTKGLMGANTTLSCMVTSLCLQSWFSVTDGGMLVAPWIGACCTHA